jgi:excisionase family DNA binding protein
MNQSEGGPEPEEWLTLSQVADTLGVSTSKVRQMVRDHELAAVRRQSGREPEVPAVFLDDGAVVKGLPGTLILLTDHGLSDAESIEWLFGADESLPGRPIDALRTDRGKEVHRRAQVIA